MLDWDDLKYFIAVARHGSTIAAGKVLGVNQSTVHRRLGELEARIGRELVARHTTGYRLTEFGRGLLPFAERVEAAVAELEQRGDDAAGDRRGVIRLTCPEPIVPRLMPSLGCHRWSLPAGLSFTMPNGIIFCFEAVFISFALPFSH